VTRQAPHRLAALCWAIGLVGALAGCGRARWTEDVRLPDGRTITLTRTQNFGGPTEIGQRSTTTQYSLEFSNPDTGERVRWERDRDLAPVAVLIHDRTPYLLLMPGFASSARELGCPDPPYLLYRYAGGRWSSTPLPDIPVKQLRANVTTVPDDDIRSGDVTHVSVARTQDSYVMNHQPWVMNFTNVHQKFDPRHCDERSDYLLDREGTAP
jgi:hypothetical protein